MNKTFSYTGINFCLFSFAKYYLCLNKLNSQVISNSYQYKILSKLGLSTTLKVFFSSIAENYDLSHMFILFFSSELTFIHVVYLNQDQMHKLFIILFRYFYIKYSKTIHWFFFLIVLYHLYYDSTVFFFIQYFLIVYMDMILKDLNAFVCIGAIYYICSRI